MKKPVSLAKKDQLVKILYLRKKVKQAQSNQSQFLFGKLGLCFMKYEILSNLSYSFGQIGFIKPSTNMIFTYDVLQKTYKERKGKIKPTERNTTFVEQIAFYSYIISGGEKDQDRLDLVTSDLNKSAKMQFGRNFHRSVTIKNQSFLISGKLLGAYTNTCEVMN